MRLNFFVFLTAFALGILYCYVSTPMPEVVYKFPNPMNAGKIKYKGPDSQCFTYRADKVECPIDRSLIRPQFAKDSATA